MHNLTVNNVTTRQELDASLEQSLLEVNLFLANEKSVSMESIDYKNNCRATSPYFIKLFEGNKVGCFNRDYKPIQVNEKGEPKLLSVEAHKFDRLKHFFSPEDDRIYLYLDKTNPFDYPEEPENKTLYTAKLQCVEQILGLTWAAHISRALK